MTRTSASAFTFQPSHGKWQIFDLVLLSFIVFASLIGMVASFSATYRIGKQPWGHDVAAVWMLGVLWFWLLIAGLVRMVIHAVGKKVAPASVVTLACFGVYVFFMRIPFGIGRVVGRFLLANTGVDQRVAQECLLLAHSGLYITNTSIIAQSGTWKLNGESNHLSQIVHEMQDRCPAICSLKPRYIWCSPQNGVDIDLASALDSYGYRFSVEGTNWILRWFTESDSRKGLDSGRKLVSLPYDKPSLVLTGFGLWQTKL